MSTKTKRVKRKRRLLLKTALLLILILLVICVATAAIYYPRVPKLDLNLFKYNQNAIIYDKNDEAYQNLEGDENRQMISSDQIPEITKDAFIAIEDKRFYSHPGVDIFGIGRALMEVFSKKNLTGSGGSTITQQLIKLTHLTTERSFERKFDEWVLALELESVYSKDEILTAYLNKINFHGAEGIQAAARQYFGKNASELGITESAILAAIPNSPTYFDPYTYDSSENIIKDQSGKVVLSSNNRFRAQRVLDEMLDQGYLAPEDHIKASKELNEGSDLVYNNPNGAYSHFTDAVYNALLEDLTETLGISEEEVVKFIKTSGLKIYSTVDPDLQAALESSVADATLFPQRSNSSMNVQEQTGQVYLPEVGMTVVDNNDGAVLGMVGGRNNDASLTLNRATTKFQIGSATKPLTVYAPALEEKSATLATVYNDVPISLGGWKPENAEKTYNGPTTVRDGIIHSVNTVAVQTLADLGIEKSVEYAKELGLEVKEEDQSAPALALGGYTEGFSTLDLASAYSTFPRGGLYIKPYLYRRVEDSAGNVLINNEGIDTGERVFSENVSYLITDALKQACTDGTANIKINNSEFAGKTGTTDNYTNAWFCGYTPQYTMSVWYGYDVSSVEHNGQQIPLAIEVSGGNKPGPAAMFETVMNKVRQPVSNFKFDETTKAVEIDKTSGKKATRATDLDPRGSQRYTEHFVPGTEPEEKDDVHELENFDTSTGYRATYNCPNSSVSRRGLIDLDKIGYPSNITPVDKNYIPTSIAHFLVNSEFCPEH